MTFYLALRNHRGSSEMRFYASEISVSVRAVDHGMKIRGQAIVSMSLRLAIPRRVGLHQSPLLLHQPRIILEEMRVFEKKKPLNGRCDIFKLSHRRGSPQSTESF
jgi:hypothetical protein